jgi:hypothetical protein
MAHSERFELPTLGIEIRCSIQLSYECTSVFNGLAGRPHCFGDCPDTENGAEIHFRRLQLPDLRSGG